MTNNNFQINFTPCFSVVFAAKQLVVRDRQNLTVREKHSTKPKKYSDDGLTGLG